MFIIQAILHIDKTNQENYSVSDPNYKTAFTVSLWYDDLMYAVTCISPCTKYLMMSPGKHERPYLSNWYK